MRRILVAALTLALSCSVVAVAPGAGASPVVHVAKKRCKHRHHHRKRCWKQSSNGSSATTPGEPGSTGTTTTPGRVLATEREIDPTHLQLQLSRPSLSAGSAIVEQYNAGSDPHNLILEKDGQAAFAYPTLDPGGDQRQTVTLTHGTWTLYCSLLNHRSLGMQASLTVN